jgi:hypothetical protein
MDQETDIKANPLSRGATGSEPWTHYVVDVETNEWVSRHRHEHGAMTRLRKLQLHGRGKYAIADNPRPKICPCCKGWGTVPNTPDELPPP